MKKSIAFVLSLWFYSMNFSISSLSKMAFDKLFDHKTWNIKKEELKHQIKDLPANFLQGQTIIGLDFSNMDLTGKDLTDCKFIRANFQGTNLTHTTFHNTHFDRCDLVGAIFHYSLEDLGNPSIDKVFKVKTSEHYLLIKQYSDIMNQKEEKEKAGLKEEAADLLKQTQCLNHLFKALNLDLRGVDIRNLRRLNLIDINLKEANLADLRATDLKRCQLFKDLRIPEDIDSNYFFNAFKKAINNDTPEKSYLLQLVNSKFDMFYKISNEDLSLVHWKGLNLENASLSDAQLYGLNLEEVNFKGANLRWANLSDTNLINANFENTDLSFTDLKRAKFSENFQLGDYFDPKDLFDRWYNANINNTFDKKYYNMLVANKFNLFEGISKESILDIIEKKLDLRNANLLFLKLAEVKLSGVNLENTELHYSSFHKSILSDINFKNSALMATDFQQTQLKNINFVLSSARESKFNQSTLDSVSFKGADLYNADFTDAKLTNVDFFAADIRWLRLSENTRLSRSDDDQDHIKFYHECTDSKAKALFKIILESRGHSLEPKGENIES